MKVPIVPGSRETIATAYPIRNLLGTNILGRNQVIFGSVITRREWDSEDSRAYFAALPGETP